jgi:outer membrane receptor protein involved in Fe transport
MPPLQLQKLDVQLSEVAVVTKKPFIEREKGKTILNIESSINATGSSAYEFLEKAPGVRIDNNDNISVSGKPGTVVWIDGKPSPMTGSDLANYLRGLSSSLIEKIEIISNPSAKYDAAGSSIINIIMKKDKKIGTNGNISLAYGQGIYPKTNNSISFNQRDKKINLFGSYSYSLRRAFNDLRLRREFYDRDTFIGAFDQKNYFRFDFTSHVTRAGVDFYANKKNTVGIVITYMANGFVREGENTSDVFNQQNQLASVFETGSDNNYQLRNFSANVNFKHSFDSSGTELTTDLDYAGYPNRSIQNFDTRYYTLNRQEFQNPYLLHGNLDGDLDIYSIKNDFTKNIKHGWKLDAGQKSSYVKGDNDLSFFNRSNGNNIYDTTKSNHFIYTENINAAYLSTNKDWEKWGLQAGLRVEHTNVKGEQLVYGNSFIRNYAQLFPNAVIKYKMKKTVSWELNYARRIRRPGYDQLNPFKYYLDPTTYREGNPYLMPSTTESFEFSNTFKEKFVTSIGFGRTFNNIIEVIAPLSNEARVTVQTNRNLSTVDVYTFNGSYPIEINKWWTSTNNFNLYYALYSGNIANTPIKNQGNVTLNFNTVNSFIINQNLSAELSGNYQSREVYAFDVIEPIWSVNLGLQQKVLKNRGTLRVNVTDVFYTNVIPAHVTYTDYQEEFLVRRDTRVATVSFSYKFGKNTVPGARRRQSGAEDIKQRAGGNVG